MQYRNMTFKSKKRMRLEGPLDVNPITLGQRELGAAKAALVR